MKTDKNQFYTKVNRTDVLRIGNLINVLQLGTYNLITKFKQTSMTWQVILSYLAISLLCNISCHALF